MVEIETWKDIPTYTHLYQVSNLGNVRSVARLDTLGRVKRGRVLKLTTKKSGYVQVGLTKDGHQRMHMVHRLVLLAFVGHPPRNTETLHFNHVRNDNRLVNLRWGTKRENCSTTDYEKVNGKPCVVMGKRYPSGRAAAVALGFKPCTLVKRINSKRFINFNWETEISK